MKQWLENVAAINSRPSVVTIKNPRVLDHTPNTTREATFKNPPKGVKDL